MINNNFLNVLKRVWRKMWYIIILSYTMSFIVPFSLTGSYTISTICLLVMITIDLSLSYYRFKKWTKKYLNNGGE